METQVLTPQAVFMHPQRLVVPLFQRRYVWNQENQWEPLWNDLVRVAERVLQRPQQRHPPHFLGAVVLQQAQVPVGSMQERTIIDGQQRLTTLQLLLDALHAALLAAGAEAPAMRIEPLVANAQPFCRQKEDRFKVWPTNRDREAFNAVMAAKPPIDYAAVGQSGERMIAAHRFFSEQANEWLRREGVGSIDARANAIETVVRELFQMVVIELNADENAQEIFETLNARGAQLTAADLIKNFVFQSLSMSEADVEGAYDRYWADFETAFWEAEISVGRLSYARSSVFLNHWLVARTGEEVIAREVFTRFKRYAMETSTPMPTLLSEIDQAAKTYRKFVEAGNQTSGAVDHVGLFAYRTSVLESEVVKPLYLYLLDAQLPAVPNAQFKKVLCALESWMVRRMIVRATTKNYNQVIAELISLLRNGERAVAGDLVESFFASQTSDSRYWPDDEEVRETMRVLPAYTRLRRGRLRMVLEAVEDHRRGWRDGNVSFCGERVTRAKFAIEHVMPRTWATNWPQANGPQGEAERNALIHTVGNLTLLTSNLNAKVSNGPWLGPGGKSETLRRHDVLFLNKDLLDSAGDNWTESAIRSRSDSLAKVVMEIWPVPAGHRISGAKQKVVPQHRVDLMDLLSAGWLTPGAPLFARPKKMHDSVATLLSDGRIDVNGVVYSRPSDAAKAITKSNTNGWWYFLVDREPRRSLKDVRLDYFESLAGDGDDDATDDDPDDDE